MGPTDYGPLGSINQHKTQFAYYGHPGAAEIIGTRVVEIHQRHGWHTISLSATCRAIEVRNKHDTRTHTYWVGVGFFSLNAIGLAATSDSSKAKAWIEAEIDQQLVDALAKDVEELLL